MAIESFDGASPQVEGAAFIAASADIIGHVQVAEDASVWYNTTIRGDVAAISIGRGSNVQDNCCLHVDYELGCHLGEYVTVGHSVTLHACTVEDKCLIGMGAIVLDGAVVGQGSIVGAHALVTKNTVIPPHSLVLGSPAKVVKQLPPRYGRGKLSPCLGLCGACPPFCGSLTHAQHSAHLGHVGSSPENTFCLSLTLSQVRV